MVEGDAVRVQRLYEKGLSAADQAAYEQAEAEKSSASQDEIRDKGVPDSITTIFQAPYALGPIMLAVVESQEKKDGINDLFETPPTSDASYLTPASLLERFKPTKVAVPKLEEGEKALDKPNVFGAFALYLMLAGRGDAGEALAVADGWGGDAMVTFSRGDATCVRAAFTGRNRDATTAISDAIATWAADLPGGAASSTRNGRHRDHDCVRSGRGRHRSAELVDRRADPRRPAQRGAEPDRGRRVAGGDRRLHRHAPRA